MARELGQTMMDNRSFAGPKAHPKADAARSPGQQPLGARRTGSIQ
jgi:hypothetical protein